MKTKILITYATYGSGHKMAAKYIYDYLKKNKDYDIKLIDVMDYGNLIAKVNLKTYNSNNHSNKIFASFFYKIFNNKVAVAPYKEIIKILFKSDLTEEILNYNPDYIISTHFFGSILMGMINKKYKTKTKIITIITDYVSHAIWLKNHKKESAIIVSNELVKQELIKYGVDKNKIYPFGIPVSSDIKNELNKEKVKSKYNVNNNKLTFLFSGGANADNYNFKYFKAIIKKDFNINLIFIAGKNNKLKNKCLNYVKTLNLENTNILILGFTKDIFNLLNISDVVITKPGGLTVTEILEMKVPMILIPGNGGQEEYNAKFIEKNNYGIKVNSSKKLVLTVNKLIKNKKIIKNIKKNLNKYEKNNSVIKLYNLIKEMEYEK